MGSSVSPAMSTRGWLGPQAERTPWGGRRHPAFGGQGQSTAAAHATFQVTDFPGQAAVDRCARGISPRRRHLGRAHQQPRPNPNCRRLGSEPGFLANGTAPIFRNFPNAPLPNVWYSKPLARRARGYRYPTRHVGETSRSISTARPTGTSGPTVARRPAPTISSPWRCTRSRITSASCRSCGATTDGASGACWTRPPSTAATWSTAAGQSLLNTSLFPNPSAALGAATRVEQHLLVRSYGIAALGGTRPKIYTPTPWTNGYGASLNHLDEATYPPGNPNSLMTPMLNTAEAIHVPGPATMGMLADMGWAAGRHVLVHARRDGRARRARPASRAQSSTFRPRRLCQWTAVSNEPGFITVTGGATSNGPSPVTFNVSAERRCISHRHDHDCRPDVHRPAERICSDDDRRQDDAATSVPPRSAPSSPRRRRRRSSGSGSRACPEP